MNSAAGGVAEEIAALFRRDLTRLLEELGAFPTEDKLWEKLPGISNSAGNLILHLDGNLREYIGRQLGGLDYRRERDLEFSGGPAPAAVLREKIEWLRERIPAVVRALPDEVLARDYPEQMWGSRLSTRQFLIHLDAHFNYHLGQIDYLRRVLTAGTAVDFTQL